MKIRKHPLHGLTLAALIATSAIGTGAVRAADGKAAQYYEDALQRYEKKDMAGAIVQLKNALKQDKKLLPVHVLLGKALLASGQAPAAEAAFEEAQRLGVNRAELVLPWTQALVAQGKLADVLDNQKFPLTGLSPTLQAQLLLTKAGAQGDLGDPKAALKFIDDARALEPNSPDSWLAEVPLRIRARQLKEATAAIDKAKALDPKAGGVYQQTASVLHVQGDLKAALAAYDQALALNPNLNDARVARAGILLDLKRNDEAAKDVALLLEKTPLEPRGWYLSAVLAEREGKPQQIKTSLSKITELLDPVPLAYIRYRPQLMMLNGQAHFGLGQREKAKPYFEGFARLQPGSPVAKLLGNIQLSEGNADRAAETLEQYLAASPGDSQAMALLASAYMAKGRNARAAELMQRALQKNDAPELYTAYGLSLLGAGQGVNALTQLETAYKKDPNQNQAATALVGLYLRAGQNAKALTIAQALVKKAPANPSYQNLLGITLAGKPDAAGARAAFETARKLDPTLLQATLNLARLESATQSPDKAQVLLAAVLKAEETNTEAMYELGVLAEKLKRPEEALRWLQRGFDVGGVKDLRTSLALVDLHMRYGRKAEALKAAQSLAAGAPDSLPVAIALARTQLLNGDLAGAKSSLGTANKLAPIEVGAQVEIAVLQLGAGNLPGAAYAASKAIEAKPDDLRALAISADIETRQGDFKKAEALAQQLIKQAPKQAVGQSLLGDLEVARRQPAAALDHYRKAQQIEPSPEGFRRLFRTQASLDLKPALALADSWLKAHPNDLGSLRLLAELQVRVGNFAAARTSYEQLRKAAPQDPGVANDLANVLVLLKDPGAQAVAEEALKLEPTNANLIDTAGWIAFRAGNGDRALQLLRDARLRAPESVVVRYHLGSVLAKAGRKAEAKEELSAAIKSKVAFNGKDDAEKLLQTLN